MNGYRSIDETELMMKANDLNKPSHEEMDLNSGIQPENAHKMSPKEKENTTPEKERYDEESTQTSGNHPTEKGQQAPDIPEPGPEAGLSAEEKPESTGEDSLSHNISEEEPRKENASAEKPAKEEIVEEKPVEEKPAEEKPVEEKPVKEKPVEEEPVEKKPVEKKPAEEVAATEKPITEKPIEEKPAEKKPAEEKPVEEKPVEEKPSEEKPAEEVAATDKPLEEKSLEGKHEEEVAAREKPATEKPAEKESQEDGLEEDKTSREESKKEQESKRPLEDLLPPQEVDYSTLSREKLLERFRKLLQNNPLHIVKGHLDAIRTTFDSKSAAERAALKRSFLESGEAEENFSPAPDPLYSAFGELLKEYRKARDEERARRGDEMERNLKAKHEVIEGIKDLVNRQESLNATFQEFRELQQRWRDIGPVPQKELHNLWETYHLHVENFYNYIKINKELRDLDLKKNLETKLELCEKAENLLLEPTIVKAFKTLQKYHDQWRETGPVPHEMKDEIWERFKKATARLNQKHQEHFESIREQFTKNLEAKKELCEKAEELNQKKYRSPREWEKASKAIIDLQQIWKTIGFAPKKDNNAVYRRFRNACDQFFDLKREFFRQYKEAQMANLEIKTELCEKAEALKESEDWKNTTHELIRIQKKWKETGPVPRKHSDAIWKKFRGACDHFFNRKSEFFNQKDEAQDKNLKLKEELIEELKAYKPDPDNEDEFNKLQEFQNRWSKIGFVPYKEKDRVNNEFRQLINTCFDQLNLDELNKSLQKYRARLEAWKGDGQFNDRITQEQNKIIGKLKQIENDINVWENNIGFFTKSKKSEALLRDFTNKIENGKQQIKLLNRKLDLIENLTRR